MSSERLAGSVAGLRETRAPTAPGPALYPVGPGRHSDGRADAYSVEWEISPGAGTEPHAPVDEPRGRR